MTRQKKAPPGHPSRDIATGLTAPASSRRRTVLLATALVVLAAAWAAPRLWEQWKAHLPTTQLAAYVQAHPDDSYTVSLLADRYMTEGRPAEAESLAAAFLARDPQQPQLWMQRSRAELEQGKLGPAYASLQVAMPSLNRSAEAHWWLGQILSRRGDEEGAVGEWQRAIELDRDFPGANLELAREELVRLHYGPALDHLKRVLRRDPRDVTALKLESTAYRSLGNLPEAEKDARILVKVAPRDAGAWQQLAETLRAQATPRSLQEAERCYTQALQFSQDASDLHQQYGQLLFSQGRYAEAAAELEASLRAHDLNPLPYPTLIQCDLRLGKRAEASRLEAKYRKIEEIDLSTAPLEYAVDVMPRNTTIRLRLARLYQKYGRRDLALAQVEEVLKVAPNQPDALQLKKEWTPLQP